MSKPSLKLPRLRADQAAIVRHPAKVKVIACGRRWGKSIMGGVMGLRWANNGLAVAWVVPIYRNARPLWRFVEKHLAAVADKVRINKTELTVAFPSGGRLGIYSADNPVGLRGESFDVVVIDEAAHIAGETYQDVIVPTLADRAGHVYLISTPAGHNWFWREWVAGQAGGTQQASWQAPSNANPLPSIQRAYQLARERLPERTFRQEWCAEFIENGGSVFRKVLDAATASDKVSIEGHQYIAGVDWGRSADFTVITVIDVTAKAMVALDRFNQIDWSLQRGRLRALYERYKPVSIIAETNSIGEPNIEALRQEGLPVQGFTTTNASKAQIIEGLSLAFETGALTILNDPTLVGELQAYELERLPSGLTRYNAPAGMHDDCVISLALAWYGITGMPRYKQPGTVSYV